MLLNKLLLTITCCFTLPFPGNSRILLLGNNGNESNKIKKFIDKLESKKLLRNGDKNCGLSLNAQRYIKTMNDLEKRYADTIAQYHQETERQSLNFDQQTLTTMLASRGRLESKGAKYEEIPAGVNLGGYFMLKQGDSLLFFHRVKLRNQTIYRINSLDTDLSNMNLKATLSFRDLHLLGSYERAVIKKDSSTLLYVPTFGLAEILLKDVEYSMDGRLRFLHDSPYIAIVNSNISFTAGLLTHRNNATPVDEQLTMEDTENGMLDKLKADMDSWLKDFFNHYLIFYQPVAQSSKTYREYQAKRTIAMNNHVEKSLHDLRNKLLTLNASSVKIPNFKFVGVEGMEIELKDGILRGMDSLYRKSVATGSKQFVKTGNETMHYVDAVIGFSELKAVYKYTLIVPNNLPPLNGILMMSVEDVTVQMALTMLENPEVVDLSVSSIQYLQEKTLTVEGPANRQISNFKHILEYHILSLMSNAVLHNLKALNTLVSCEPSFFGHLDYGSYQQEIESDDEDDYDKKEESLVDENVKTECPTLPTADDTYKSKNGKPKINPDYVLNKEDSIEVEVPNGSNKAKKYRMILQQNMAIQKLS